jgi:hypothetical protein
MALPRWLPAGVMIPVAAAAAVVAIALVAVSLTGGAPTRSRDLGTGPVSETSTTPSSPGTPRQVTDLLRTNPAVTSIVSVKVGANLVYVWFSNLKDDYLCYVVVGIPTPGGGDKACFSYTAPILKDTVLGPELITPIAIGKAVMRATSITVRLSDGGSAPAAIVSGRGFPFKVCFANIPPQYSSTIVVRDAAGHELAHDYTDVQLGTSVPGTGGILLDGWTAYLVSGRVLWHGPDDGAVVPLPWTVKQKPLMVLFQRTTKVNYALGYTPADVARLELRFPDGAKYSAPTVSAWPGSAERLWVKTGLPWNGIPSQTLVISYNSASKRIAQQTLTSLSSPLA